MPRSHYRAPFHRRVIPWIFIAVFIVAAPTLIFYTSGYRFNPNKNTIERNGTLILDTEPGNALIELTGNVSNMRTPETLQSMAPGPYRIRFTLDGYHPWEKTLEIKPEQVTFANTVMLWKDTDPALLRTTEATRITSNNDGDLAAAYDYQNHTIQFLSANGSLLGSLPLPKTLPTSTGMLLRWNQSGTSVLINGRSTDDVGVLVNSDRRTPAEVLPAGVYFWNGNTLIGHGKARSYILESRQGSLESEVLTDAQRGHLDGLTLQHNTSTDTLVIRSGSILHQLYSLPNGDWQFAGKAQPYQLLKDGNRWLAVRIRATGNESRRITGDEPRWLQDSNIPTAIFLNGNELWVWELDKEPVLISRQSEQFIQAVWHPKGTTIFAAIGKTVYAIELDDRSGRIWTPLASFDRIEDVAYLNGSLVIAAEQNNLKGIWRLELE
ncbi:PEGA domain-containing protein [Candidatus Uhrbacteria bacterium]|nr:PEGA domain-containing protein [Candidatus Uhrbacteria bacterium]